MKAQVFSLQEQEAMRRAIARSLRAFYEDIEITHRVYDEGDDSKKIGGSYLRLLKASTIAVDAFTVEVEDEYGSWDYWEYYYYTDRVNHFLRLSHDSLEKVFPGVAIMDRMVMVPEGLRDALDAPTDFAHLLKPLNLQGVLCVDFDARYAIRNAVERVGAEIKAEIVSLAQRQMAMNRLPTPDLEDLSKLLDVHVEFLEELRQEILSPLPRLAVEITSGSARLNRVSRVALKITNESENTAGIVDVEIRAPWSNVEEPPTHYTEQLDFSFGHDQQHTMEIDIFPRATPYFPLEVVFLFPDITDAITFPRPVILDVGEN